MGKVEVWFNNGEVRSFPNVVMKSFKQDYENDFITFIFGRDPENNPHKAWIKLSNVNFVETMEEKED